MAITTQGLLRTSGSALAFTLGGMLPLLSAFVLLPYYTKLSTADDSADDDGVGDDDDASGCIS